MTGDTSTGESDTLGENEFFTAVNEIVYATGTVNIRSGPSVDTEKVGSLNRGDSVTRTGIGTGDYAKWSRVQLSDGREMFIATSYLSLTQPTANNSTTQGSTQTTKPSTGTQGGTGDTLAGEPNNGGGTTDSSGLTPAEQAMRDKFLKENENLNTPTGESLTDQDVKDMLKDFFGN